MVTLVTVVTFVLFGLRPVSTSDSPDALNSSTDSSTLFVHFNPLVLLLSFASGEPALSLFSGPPAGCWDIAPPRQPATELKSPLTGHATRCQAVLHVLEVLPASIGAKTQLQASRGEGRLHTKEKRAPAFIRVLLVQVEAQDVAQEEPYIGRHLLSSVSSAQYTAPKSSM